MNEVCDNWNSAWRTLQRQLAKDSRAHAGQTSRFQRGSDPTSWLGRALNRATPTADARSAV
jgi:hypothetical protein